MWTSHILLLLLNQISRPERFFEEFLLYSIVISFVFMWVYNIMT